MKTTCLSTCAMINGSMGPEQDDAPESIHTPDGADAPYIPCDKDGAPEHCVMIHGATQPTHTTKTTRVTRQPHGRCTVTQMRPYNRTACEQRRQQQSTHSLPKQ